MKDAANGIVVKRWSLSVLQVLQESRAVQWFIGCGLKVGGLRFRHTIVRLKLPGDGDLPHGKLDGLTHFGRCPIVIGHRFNQRQTTFHQAPTFCRQRQNILSNIVQYRAALRTLSFRNLVRCPIQNQATLTKDLRSQRAVTPVRIL